MQAEGIRTGDKSETYDDHGRVIAGWTATGDAVVAFSEEDGKDMVFVPVKHYDGGEGARVFEIGANVPLSWGAGGDIQRTVKYPPGSPEYEAYAAELRAELAKFAAGEPPYDGDRESRERQIGRLRPSP
jgi:hypothetical protein